MPQSANGVTFLRLC